MKKITMGQATIYNETKRIIEQELEEIKLVGKWLAKGQKEEELDELYFSLETDEARELLDNLTGGQKNGE